MTLENVIVFALPPAGSFGSAFLYFQVPRVILFREEHTPRVFVEKVDFISAPGVSAPEVHRPGGPHALVTGKALFSFDRDRQCFCLKSLHPGISLEEVQENTGFAFDLPEGEIPETVPPTPEDLALMRGLVGRQAAETYPRFASKVLGVEL